MNKKKILVFIDWFVPGYKAGGPIRSCANLVEHLQRDFYFSIVTRNTDLGEAIPYNGIDSNRWNVVSENVRIFYFSRPHLTVKNIKSILCGDDYDYIYLNSFFSFWFTIVPLLIIKFLGIKKPVILAPRGMLGKGALSIKSRKKMLFILSAKISGMYRNMTWHATGEGEKNDIRKHFGSEAMIKIAFNLPERKSFSYSAKAKQKGFLNLVFLSRISRKKNIAAVFDYFHGIKTAGEINFDIYGPLEDTDYWKKCEEQGRSLPSNINFSYRGTIPHSEVFALLSRYHFFIFPTFHENYGHVVLESLLAGCPVILSDNTIWNDLEKKHAGWDISLSKPEKFVEVIERCLSMNQEEYDLFSQGAFDLGMSVKNNKETVEQSKLLFNL